jgi:thioredoxin reductase (NADPH)
MMIRLIGYLLLFLILVLPLVIHFFRTRAREERARAAAEKGQLISDPPRAQHPHIDTSKCIGCGACVRVCPEGDVLAVFAGKATIINGYKCIGHSLCADACPVGAIEMVMAHPSMSADMPRLTPEHETSIGNMFIVGELGGLALIKNAVNQGRDCVDTIAARLAEMPDCAAEPDVYQVCVVGAGPAGISASLRAIEMKLSYITIEQDEMGGTVAKYPRQKLVMTSPVEFPMHGRFSKMELSKEDLLAFWGKIAQRTDFTVRTNEKVEDIQKGEDGIFTVSTSKAQYRALAVILALGRRGTPRKLGVQGEELPKVMYSLLEADAYTNCRVLVVGGGDSAVEAAMGLAYQKGNEVTLSYRKENFTRIKERNSRRIAECMRDGKVRVIFNSSPVEIKEKTVVLEIDGSLEEIPNDFVWIFAGGTPPNAFLERVGVAVGLQDLTLEAGNEARLASSMKST